MADYEAPIEAKTFGSIAIGYHNDEDEEVNLGNFKGK